MDNVLLIIVLFLGFLAIIVFINKKLSDIAEKQKPDQIITQFLHSFDTRSQEQTRQIWEQTKNLNERLDSAARVIGEVQKSIGEMSEIGRGMKDLQEFLKSPKLRGNVGEHILKELLGQMLPKQTFHLQYTFKSGDKVDAAIKTAAGIIPVDSKFPMENFRKMVSAQSESETKTFGKDFERDVKTHIDDISKKYILTDEGTIDYALMYIPSEAVYYEIVNNPSLFEYSGDMRVLPVSPTTFYAYLKAILMSFEGQKIEAKAKEILSAVRAMQKDYTKVEDNLSVLQKHLNNAYNTMSSVITSFTHLGQKISSTRSLSDNEEKPLSSS